MYPAAAAMEDYRGTSPPVPLDDNDYYNSDDNDDDDDGDDDGDGDDTMPVPPGNGTMEDTTATTTSRKSRSVSYRLSRDEKKDVVSALEHIVTVGSHVHQTTWRANEWKRRQQECLRHTDFLNQDDSSSKCCASSTISSTLKQSEPSAAQRLQLQLPLTWESRLVHAEDHRIYPKKKATISSGEGKGNGKDNNDQGMIWNWPREKRNGEGKRKRRSRRVDDDDEWDQEHGDGIDISAFTDALLSREDPNKPSFDEQIRPASKGAATNHTNTYHHPTSSLPGNFAQNCDGIVTPRNVPRAMLLRCWERAVHAASCATNPVHYPNVTTSDLLGGDTEPFDSSVPIQSRSSQQESSTKSTRTNKPCTWTYAAAVQKCASLNIDLALGQGREGEQPPFACCSCSCTFDSSEDLKRHFFGGKRQRGCCWNLIRAKQQRLIEGVLNKELEDTTDGLIDILFSGAKDAIVKRQKESQGSGEERQKFNWQDVMHLFDSSVNSATCMTNPPIKPFEHDASTRRSSRTDTTEPILETLKFHPQKKPIVLNKDILEGVSRSLIERYADIQR